MIITAYFERETLLAGFHAALDTALEELTLSLPEAQWLRRLADDAQAPDSMRVEAQSNAQPLASGCLLIHQRDPSLQAVYLYSPLHGVQGYDTLAQLESALQTELAHLGVATDPLQFVELNDPVFDQWSQRLLQQQVDLLDGLANSLGQLPTLRTAMDTSVTTAFATLLEGIDDIPGHRLQILAADKVIRTQTLNEAALQTLTGEPLGLGLQRRFLRSDAKSHDTEFDVACADALSNSAKALPDNLGQALANYWTGSHQASTTDRRDTLALALADNYARAVLRASGEKRIDTEQLEWLRQVLLPGTDPLRASSLELSLPVQEEEGSQRHITVADSLVLAHPCDAGKGLFLFRSSSGLRFFADENALGHHCRALLTQGDRPASIGKADWEDLQSVAPAGIRLSEIKTPVFTALADSIIALVSRHLSYALQFPGAQASTAAATVEDALDIRALIDERLLRLENRARWLVPGQTNNASGLPALPDLSPTLADKLSAARAVIRMLHKVSNHQPDMRAVVRELLAASISALTQGSIGPDDLRVSHAKRTMPLIDYFFLRLSSTHAVDTDAQLEVLDSAGHALAWPSATALSQQVEAMTLNFSRFYLDQQKAFDEGPLRLGAGVILLPAAMRSAHEALLRLQLAVAREDAKVDAALLDLLQDALDNPQQSLSAAGFRVRGLSLKMPGKSGVLTVTAAFVLQRPAPDDGALLLWSPLEPLSQFDNEQTLLAEMDGALAEPEKLYPWLDLVHAEDLRKWHSPSVLPGVSIPNLLLTTATTDLFAHIERTASDYRANTRLYYLSYGIRSDFDALLLERFVDAVVTPHPIQKPLKRLEQRLEGRYFQSLLPSWLGQATAEQMEVYAQLVQASAKVSNPKFNYLFGIERMEDFANARLTKALRDEYPEAPSDPLLITITITHYSPNPVLPGQTPSPIGADTISTHKSLTEYALSHTDTIGGTITTQASANIPGQPSDVLDMARLRRLVDKLDVATAYRNQLAKKLGSDSPDHSKRRERFAQIATPYLMEEAYQHFLEKKLSAQGMYCLSHVLNQPDALARDSSRGEKISISQLQLRATADLPPDAVRGMYVIGPDRADAGPLVLYCAYLPDRLFTEHANQAALLAHILADKDLQKIILDRLPEAVHKRYNHDGFLHPHVFWSSDDLLDIPAPTDPVRLLRTAIDGNALHYLYEDNTAMLNEFAKARTVTTAEAKWQRFRYLVSLSIEQCSFFLPGKLAVVLASLQGLQWLKASQNAANKGNWGESLAEFVTALSSLASLLVVAPPLSRKDPVVASKPRPGAEEIHQGWNDALFPAGVTGRLSTLQAREVELKDLVANTALGLYIHSDQRRYFAVMAGHVYEVKKSGGRWQIIHGEIRGPDLTRVNGLWQLDPKEGLRGGGAVVSMYQTAATDTDIESIFTVLASGMTEINRLHPFKHAMLVRAYSRSRYYLETCLENLNASNPDAPLPPRATNILRNAFDAPASPQTLEVLRDYTKRLLNELLSASMNVNDSKRIVVGVNMPETRDTYGFVYSGDPGKRIFLSERVFALTHEIQAYAKPSHEQLLAHQQALTLIHELSHQVLKTVDIAYLEASAPFLDQFSLSTAGGRKIHAQVEEYQRDGLSSTTPDGALFKTYDNLVWRDIRKKDGRALPAIYRLTGTSNLMAARKAFRDDATVRTNVILANADSLALLISMLGRRRYAPAG